MNQLMQVFLQRASFDRFVTLFTWQELLENWYILEGFRIRKMFPVYKQRNDCCAFILETVFKLFAHPIVLFFQSYALIPHAKEIVANQCQHNFDIFEMDEDFFIPAVAWIHGAFVYEYCIFSKSFLQSQVNNFSFCVGIVLAVADKDFGWFFLAHV